MDNIPHYVKVDDVIKLLNDKCDILCKQAYERQKNLDKYKTKSARTKSENRLKEIGVQRDILNEMINKICCYDEWDY